MWGEIETNWEIDAAQLTNPQDFHLYEIIDSYQIQNKDIFFLFLSSAPFQSLCGIGIMCLIEQKWQV